MKEWTIYIHENMMDGKVYVGATSQRPENRWRKNGEGYKTGYDTPTRFFSAITEYGWDAFEHHIIKTGVQTQEEAYRVEQKLITLFDAYNPEHGYNSTKGGAGALGIRYSEEERQRRADRRRGVIASPETRAKMSAAKKGCIPWNKGKHKTDNRKGEQNDSNFVRIEGGFREIGI